MTGSISFGGIGSGIDTESIVNGLISASRAGLSPLKSRSASAKAAVSTISDIGSLLSKLKTSLEALDTTKEAGSYKATSSGSAITPTASGSALPGTYSVKVNQLASEQRTYSTTFASDSAALGLSGDLGIQVGSGELQTIAIEATDTLSSLVNKINAADARVSAGVVFDGSNYRLQIRGLDTGAENSIAFSGSLVGDFGFDNPAATVQQAKNAEIELDTFTITSATNQVAGAIPGVTLALNEVSTEPVKVSIEKDPEGLKTKLNEFVSTYNSIVTKIQQEAGFGGVAAKNPVLAGDSSLRAISSRLGKAVVDSANGNFDDTLASIGIRLNNNGTLRLDDAALGTALESDPAKVARVLAGDDSTNGVMDALRDLVKGFTEAGTGLLDVKKEALNNRAETLNERIEREEARLDVQAELLRRQFTQMDQTVSANQSELDYLIRLSLG